MRRVRLSVSIHAVRLSAVRLVVMDVLDHLAVEPQRGGLPAVVPLLLVDGSCTSGTEIVSLGTPGSQPVAVACLSPCPRRGGFGVEVTVCRHAVSEIARHIFR